MPVALISTSTSPAFGPSRSSSMISSGFFASNATAARVFIRNSTFAFQGILRFDFWRGPDRNPSDRSTFAHAGVLCFLGGRRFVFMLCGPRPGDSAAGAGTQIDVDVVHITRDVRIVAERRHDVLIRRVDVLATACDHSKEVAVPHRLERILQGRCVTGTHAIRAVADMTFRVIPAAALKGGAVDGATGRAADRTGVLAILR